MHEQPEKKLARLIKMTNLSTLLLVSWQSLQRDRRPVESNVDGFGRGELQVRMAGLFSRSKNKK
jgi:hypothetical protein